MFIALLSADPQYSVTTKRFRRELEGIVPALLFYGIGAPSTFRCARCRSMATQLTLFPSRFRPNSYAILTGFSLIADDI